MSVEIESLKAVIKRQSSFSETYDVKMPPVLYLQVFDNDLISEDDFLGSIEIHLSHMEPPFPTAKLCTLNRSEENRRNLKSIFTLRNSSTVQIENKYLDLFKEKKIRGWFPLKGHRKHYHKKHKINNELDKMLTGKIELEMEVLTAADAEHKPVGIGRHPPHALPDPEYVLFITLHKISENILIFIDIRVTGDRKPHLIHGYIR